ncbi:UDP-2,3-diacylglucosamine diphosphatase [Mucilaginibacter hurinus]|uniref:UDP-2,3-diacylglucosamine diphosphatase n=1 Tax=Mucilaginibacter hurinus TaxID=2201324 RepID=A0A367GJR1_9SPHI|nr:UDP-2,3-diacylglucosamine diphosphatase [Mucilaginibacter hurinus]RCH53704.1 UDP-2,3-diacylglucosamine diphosphatase [Mucilaginibacter hurinus]
MSTFTKLYFASDFHLGTNSHGSSRDREARLVRWLESIKHDAAEIFLMGDVFEFWFEYKTVVPKGYIRFLGKLAELTDAGIKLYLFKGNHDMWMFDYFKNELGATIISNELVIERGGKKFFLHHGDGIGPGDTMYKLLKTIFRSKICQWLFARIHPNFGMGMAGAWSQQSRDTHLKKPKTGQHEWLPAFSREMLKKEHYDYFIYGHHHLPMIVDVGPDSTYVNLGEWFNYNSYAVFDGRHLTLEYFEKPTED